MKEKSKWITTAGFLLALFGLSFAFWITPDRLFSEQENRSLRTLPHISMKKVISGDYSSEINDYFADQFPMRDAWVGQKGIAELLLGKGENDGVLIGDDGQLAKRFFDAKSANGLSAVDIDAFDPEHIKASVDGINRLENNLEIPLSVLLTGRTIDVAASAFSYPSNFSDHLLSLIKKEIASDVDYLDTVPMYRELFQNGEYVYYKTDHHWTTLGAYYAYCEIMKSFDMQEEIIPASSFEKRVVEEPFYGTAWSAGGMKFVSPDKMELWLGEDEDSYSVTVDGKDLGGFYRYEYLTKKDKYSVFLDGTHDVVTITKKDAVDRPVLLLVKDSFANSLAPFLARHFDLVLLNLSSSKNDYTNVSAYAKEYGADRVLLVYTLENVITADKLCRLK